MHTDETLSVGSGRDVEAATIHELCRWFLSDLESGKTPRIETYLAGREGSDRGNLFRELLRIEFGYRRQRGESSTLDDYRERFRDEFALLDSGEPAGWLESTLTHAGSDRDDATVALGNTQPASGRADFESDPPLIGRYRFVRRISEGGFGRVLLGHDDELDRPVAIKLPKRLELDRFEVAEMFLKEARFLASLDHPGVVPVYDAGRTEDGVFYVVSKFIDGQDLAHLMRKAPPGAAESARLVAAVAEALQHAHDKGLVHRDVKPANLLIDQAGQIYVGDFGLALQERDWGNPEGMAGTPAYMSPEQIRLEGHRVDGRSDVFSLGVVFYELLTGSRPYRGKSLAELVAALQRQQFRRPHEFDSSIPLELERICLRAITVSRAERYGSAREMADDLRAWLHQPTWGSPTDAAAPPLVVPRGLRAFGREDAGFFLSLLPGPRGRDGLPEILRFWKTRVEDVDGGAPFSLGVLVGPSGCGKSSLVRAGLLPRLAANMQPVYVECTEDGTEARLLAGVLRRCPLLGPAPSLAAAIEALRRTGGGLPGRKILLVLDQFEQWLSAHQEPGDTELARALRQCDGPKIQALLLVRDDYWMSLVRFLKACDADAVPGVNSAVVDLFEPTHARKVLERFGRAYGQIGVEADPEDGRLAAFLDRAVDGLARDGRVVPVRLALFAEMIKEKPWTPDTLRAVGGAQGVGLAFLEETFHASGAHPAHREHERAARSVLQALLPGGGTNFKGNMQSREALREASGYAHQPEKFEELIRILDGELRLITPTDPVASDPEATDAPGTPARFYQLTHDYLVPSLRNWLTSKQRQTRQGRAELRLAESSAAWGQSPNLRSLPTLLDWSSIRLFTSPRRWTAGEKRLMKASDRLHLRRIAIVAALAAMLAWGARELNGQARARGLASSLSLASTGDLPTLVAQMRGFRSWLDPLLRERLARPNLPAGDELRLRLALLPVDPEAHRDRLVELLLDQPPDVVRVVEAALRKAPDASAAKTDATRAALWTNLENPRAVTRQRFNAALALAGWDPPRTEIAETRWAPFAGFLSERLLTTLEQDPTTFLPLRDLLRPIQAVLEPSLLSVFQGEPGTARGAWAVSCLVAFHETEPGYLADRLLETDDSESFQTLLAALRRFPEACTERMKSELEARLEPKWDDPAAPAAWQEPPPGADETLAKFGGRLEGRFAFCQAMPAGEFDAFAQGLTPSGYRPTKLRPYREGDAWRVAAVWARDGRPWRWLRGTAEAIHGADLANQNDGFRAIDVAVGLDPGGAPLFTALFAQDDRYAESSLLVGMTPAQIEAVINPLLDRKFHPLTRTGLGRGPDRLLAEVWAREGTPPENSSSESGQSRHWLTAQLSPSRLTRDIQVVRSDPIAPLAPASDRPWETAANAARHPSPEAMALAARGAELAAAGELAAAVTEYDQAIEKAPGESPPSWLGRRALLHARLSHAAEATADRDALPQDTVDQRRLRMYVDLVASAHLGRAQAAIARLDEALAADPVADAYRHLPGRIAEPARWVVPAAACAHASAIVREREPELARVLEGRALALLREAERAGALEIGEVAALPEFDSLRALPEFTAIIDAGKLGYAYGGVWVPDARIESRALVDLSIADQQAQARQLAGDGWRMVSISVAGPEESVAVWQRPVVGEDEKDRLAWRQARALVVLAQLLGRDALWPPLRLTPEPRVRSILINRMRAWGIPAHWLVDRLGEEPDQSARRGLVQALGEYTLPLEGLAPAQTERLLETLGGWYRDGVDPGMRSAAEWLLRRWNQADLVAQARQDLEARARAELAEHRELGLAPGQSWYVTGQGQVMIAIRGPVEFLMGSPGSEPGREAASFSDVENLHARRIERNFAIAATEVTTEQFLRFHPRHPYNVLFSRTSDSPILSLTWYLAAEFCNWLSEQEGIPRDQWCYLPNSAGEFASGMGLAPDFLNRRGYRLPTEAEWEYACRAGTVTSRYFGHSEALMARYIWAGLASPDQTRPVGLLKPNDLGFFDMLGNAFEWCQDDLWIPPYPGPDRSIADLMPAAPVTDDQERILRGGTFVVPPYFIRSATRDRNKPASRFDGTGFRVARTLP
jgi:formylglycine-generating enzyme required for sulfatase activity